MQGTINSPAENKPSALFARTRTGSVETSAIACSIWCAESFGSIPGMALYFQLLLISIAPGSVEESLARTALPTPRPTVAVRPIHAFHEERQNPRLVNRTASPLAQKACEHVI